MVDEKKHISKKEKIEMSVSIVLYTISLVLAQLPWFVLKGKRYNLYSAYFHVKRYGTSGLSEAGAIHMERESPVAKNPAYCIWVI